jgi:hypothetical protein
VWFAFSVTVPFVGGVKAVIDSSSAASGSVSFASAGTSTAVSSAVVALSFTASGARFVSRTVMVTVASFDLALPSLAVYVNVSVPLKPALGV